MSIRIDGDKCTACGKCRQICPGKLLYPDQANKAFIRYPQDCWGCTACLKECRSGAIEYYLGADIGGKGTVLYTTQEQDLLYWHFRHPDGREQSVAINRKEANKY